MTTFKVSGVVWGEEEDDDEDSFEKVGDSSIEKKLFSPSYSNFLASEAFLGW